MEGPCGFRTDPITLKLSLRPAATVRVTARLAPPDFSPSE